MKPLKHIKIYGSFDASEYASAKNRWTTELNYGHPDNARLLWDLLNDRIYPSFNTEKDDSNFRNWIFKRIVTPPPVWYYWMPDRKLWSSALGLMSQVEAAQLSVPNETDGADGLTFDPIRSSERLIIGDFGRRYVNVAYYDIELGAPVLLNHVQHQWQGRVTLDLLASILPPYIAAKAWDWIVSSTGQQRLVSREHRPDGTVIETFAE